MRIQAFATSLLLLLSLCWPAHADEAGVDAEQEDGTALEPEAGEQEEAPVVPESGEQFGSSACSLHGPGRLSGSWAVVLVAGIAVGARRRGGKREPRARRVSS